MRHLSTHVASVGHDALNALFCMLESDERLFLWCGYTAEEEFFFVHHESAYTKALPLKLWRFFHEGGGQYGALVFFTGAMDQRNVGGDDVVDGVALAVDRDDGSVGIAHDHPKHVEGYGTGVQLILHCLVNSAASTHSTFIHEYRP